MMVTVAILATLSMAAMTFGTRLPRAHHAELALQAALGEARGIAATIGDATDPSVPTGATVTVERDPGARFGFGSIITVYRSRPVRTPALGATGGVRNPAPLVADVGFPIQHIAATFHLSRAQSVTEPPFTILISHAGYVSILAGYRYDPTTNAPFTGGDPGCIDGTVSIAADDGIRKANPAAFSCRGATLLLPETPNAG